MTAENLKARKSCCQKIDSKIERKGFLKGILYGLTPHIFCIAFIIFSVFGTTTATTLLKPLLLNRYFFYFLIALSLIFATISALFYLKKNEILSFQGIKIKWKYLSVLYGTTIVINLLLFMIIFPLAVNVISKSNLKDSLSTSLLSLKVDIPCPGHAPLIIEELKKINGVNEVKFRFPNLFDVNYDSQRTTQKEILSLKVFKTYSATFIREETGRSSKNTLAQSASNSGSLGVSCAPGCGGSTGGCGCGCRR